jgi:hypothetical protein
MSGSCRDEQPHKCDTSENLASRHFRHLSFEI